MGYNYLSSLKKILNNLEKEYGIKFVLVNPFVSKAMGINLDHINIDVHAYYIPSSFEEYTKLFKENIPRSINFAHSDFHYDIELIDFRNGLTRHFYRYAIEIRDFSSPLALIDNDAISSLKIVSDPASVFDSCIMHATRSLSEYVFGTKDGKSIKSLLLSGYELLVCKHIEQFSAQPESQNFTTFAHVDKTLSKYMMNILDGLGNRSVTVGHIQREINRLEEYHHENETSIVYDEQHYDKVYRNTLVKVWSE
jgi:hypothetical protein